MTREGHPRGAGALPPAQRPERRDVDGIILLDKPEGISSNQALQRVKRLFMARKAGHTGSLDPLASGMLPVCLGQATKVSAFLLDSDKTYRVQVAFGAQTTTGDAEGPVTASGPSSVSEPCLRRTLQAFQGAVSQVPPMYSALKHQGHRLYELARAGREVARRSRVVHIRMITVEVYDPERPVLTVHCSKGTYIRTLVEDIARHAGTVAHVAALRRLTVEPFREAGMLTLQALEDAASYGFAVLDRLLIGADDAVPSWPAVHLTPAQTRKLQLGQEVVDGGNSPPTAGMVRLYAEGGRFLGVGESLGGSRIVPRRLMAGPSIGSMDG